MAQPDFKLRQFHNQAVVSPLHRHLVALWRGVAAETAGVVDVQVFPENNRIAGSDPAALEMVVKGEIGFFTLMGGLLSNLIPVGDFQSVPFAFRDAAHALAVSDGVLGDLLRREMKAQGLHGFACMTFDNGMRQIGTKARPVRTPTDLAGVTIRTPDGVAFKETFEALGAIPIAINVNGIVEGLESGRVDGQENALAVMEVFRLDRAQRYVALSNHMWSGFNLMANLGVWQRFPADIQAIIERHVRQAILAQRAEQAQFNASVQATFEARGLIFNDIDQAAFRSKLRPVYARWREKLGPEAWALLARDTGLVA